MVLLNKTGRSVVVDVKVGAFSLWSVLFATGLATESLGFTCSDFRLVVLLSWLE